MRLALRAVFLGGAALWASSALAEDFTKPHVLDHITITGSKTVPTSDLTAVLQERPGAKVVQDDILADREAVMKVLEAHNVGGKVAIRISTKPDNHHILVEFAVEDQGVQAPVVVKVDHHLHQEIFDGNKAVPTETLQAATGLKPGQVVTNDTLAAAQKAIGAAYTAAKVPVNASLSGEVRSDANGQTDIIWHITETKVKKKGHETEDDRSKLED
jgi:outer membrane protein assembly factor BamA